MAGFYDNAREGAVSPGAEHPGGGPTAPTTAPGDPEAPVTPGAPAGEPEAPTGPTPAGDPGSAPPPAEDPATTPVPAGDPPPPGPPAGDPEAPTSPASAAEAQATAQATAPPTAEAATDGSAEAATDGSAEGDHERQLERDLEELTAKAQKADEYLELAKRTKADFENYKKRANRQAAEAQERGIAKLARELLPAVDNLDRAVAAVESAGGADVDHPNGTATLISGIKLVHADVLAALQRAGIERYSPKGEAFDPQRHEAIAQHAVEGTQPGTIVEVYQQGYRLGEAVIRPARVVVAG